MPLARYRVHLQEPGGHVHEWEGLAAGPRDASSSARNWLWCRYDLMPGRGWHVSVTALEN